MILILQIAFGIALAPLMLELLGLILHLLWETVKTLACIPIVLFWLVPCGIVKNLLGKK